MVNIVLGTMNILNPYSSKKTSIIEEKDMINCFFKNYPNGYIDTAYYYGQGKSQERLGKILSMVSEPYRIASKANPWYLNDFSSNQLGQLNKEGLTEQCKACNHDLGKKLDLFYLHAYDHETLLTETLETIDLLYRRKEYFDKWGISNFSYEHILNTLEICDKNDYLFPSCYQGMYNMFCRRVEVIFPLIRDYDMSFLAYNPLCGGLIINCNKKEPIGRFENPVYQSIFGGLSFVNACKEFNLKYVNTNTIIEKAYDWIINKSYLNPNDSLIIGASSLEQLENNISILKNIKSNKDDLFINSLYNSILDKDMPNYWY
jgi:aflatoxin B1 aldehyde reductase